MGNVPLAREDGRGVWIAPWLESVWQDGRYAVRSLRKNPGCTVTAILPLGLGISLNVSVFTMFNTLALTDVGRAQSGRDRAAIPAAGRQSRLLGRDAVSRVRE